MLPQIESLLILQDRDRRLADLKRQLEIFPEDERRARTKLQSDKAAVEGAKRIHQENEIAIKKVSLDVETRQTTISRLKKQQFETRKNDEYTALGHEVIRYSDDIGELETKQLELMEKADELKAQLKNAEADLQKTSKLIDEDLAAIAARKKNTEEEIGKLSAETERMGQDIDPDLLNLYQRLRVTKNGVVVAPMTAGQCGGCHVRLIPATIVKVLGEKVIAQCENCSRILYGND